MTLAAFYFSFLPWVLTAGIVASGMFAAYIKLAADDADGFNKLGAFVLGAYGIGATWISIGIGSLIKYFM